VDEIDHKLAIPAKVMYCNFFLEDARFGSWNLAMAQRRPLKT
jgi:hypothetical protein